MKKAVLSFDEVFESEINEGQFLESMPEIFSKFANFCLFIKRSDKNKVKIVLTEKEHDFINWYARLLLPYRSDNIKIVAFMKTNGKWHSSIPPVVISAHVETRLRDDQILS